jgi:hypothetical protein
MYMTSIPEFEAEPRKSLRVVADIVECVIDRYGRAE